MFVLNIRLFYSLVLTVVDTHILKGGIVRGWGASHSLIDSSAMSFKLRLPSLPFQKLMIRPLCDAVLTSGMHDNIIRFQHPNK